MLLGLWGPLKSKSMANGKLMDFYFLFFSFFFSSCLRYFFSLLKLFSYVLKKCSNVVLNYDWKLEIAVDGGGGWALVIWNAKRMSLFMAAFCEQLLRQTQILMSCEYYEFSKRARTSYNITLLCIFIPAIYRDQLWLESQAFISEPRFVFIKTLICSGLFNLIFLALH